MKRTIPAALATGLVATLLVALAPSSSVATTAEFDYVPGNPTCQELGYDYGFKPGGAAQQDVAGTWDDPASDVQVTWSYASGATSIDWSSTIPASGVIVKAGNGANVYDYAPPASSDTGLQTPDNNGGQQAALSHLVFCYTIAPTVTKTAVTSFTRTYAWDIDKSADRYALTLAIGETFSPVNYDVEVLRGDEPVDSDFAVSGDITITNPWPIALTVTEVADSLVLDAGDSLDCPTLPVLLEPGGEITCDYAAALDAKADGVNQATVTSVAAGSQTPRQTTAVASFTFGEPTTTVDECVAVTDQFPGLPLDVLDEELCDDASFEYPRDIGPFDAPGTYEVTNEACYETNDTGATGCDPWTVVVTVPPNGVGCTLTQGYWKTHSARGPAPYDDNWANLGVLQENTGFFGSGQTWYEVFWTPPKGGNVYYQLAHQYLAARLNVLNGASVPAAVSTALTTATGLFSATSGTTMSKANAALAKPLATLLDQYNNGVTGPGHCSE